MSELIANDVALIVNRRVLQHLAASLDLKFQPEIAQQVLGLTLAAAFSSELEIALERGLEAPIELVANAAMPVPRVLYATANSDFVNDPDLFNPALSERERLLNRLARYDEVAAGPVVQTIPAYSEGVENPCEIVIRADPGNRYTLLRDAFFSADSLPSITVVEDTNNPVNSGIAITLTGSAYRGDLFSRHLAFTAPTHSFSITLLYRAAFVNDSDINLGPVPFQVTATPSTPPSADAPPLPGVGQLLYTRRRTPPDGDANPDNSEFFLPTTEGGGTGGVFYGLPGDEIYELEDDAAPRFVVTTNPDQPQRYVVEDRAGAAPQVVAKALGGRLLLRFQRVTALTLTPLGSNGPANLAASQASVSLIKLQPTLAQAFTCAAGMADAPFSLSQLDLLGPTSLDIPLIPRSLVISTEPRFVKSDDINPPGPVGSVASVILLCNLQGASFDRYFADTQSFGISGQVGGNGDGLFFDFSAGADLSIGLSGDTGEPTFLRPMLEKVAQDIRKGVLKDPPPGFDTNSLSVSGSISASGLRIRATGNGTVSTPWPLPDIDYDFSAQVRVRMRVQPAVAIDRAVVTFDPPGPAPAVDVEINAPMDRFNNAVPAGALSSLLLSVDDGRLLLPAALPGGLTFGSPDRNPLSFLAYEDPANGVACFDCAPPTRIPPPVLDDDGNEIAVDPANPPAGSDGDDVRFFGQASFDPQLNPGLRMRWALAPIPPSEDAGDIEVDVEGNVFAMFLCALLGSFALALAPLVPFVGVELAIGLLAGLTLLPFASVIASAIATDMVEEQVAKQDLPTFNPSLGQSTTLGLFLEDPNVRAPFEFQGAIPGLPGAMVMRYHVVVNAAGLNEAFPEG